MRARAVFFLRRTAVLIALLASVVLSVAGFAQDAVPPNAADPTANVRQIWQLVDYIAVDYVEAVENGAIKNEGEYAEMTEFAATVHTRLATLPAREGQAALIAQADALKTAI